MKNPIPEQSEPTPKAEAATTARLRPAQAAPVQRDPREDGCINEQLMNNWVGWALALSSFATPRVVALLRGAWVGGANELRKKLCSETAGGRGLLGQAPASAEAPGKLEKLEESLASPAGRVPRLGLGPRAVL
jgi:hypothetical protein